MTSYIYILILVVYTGIVVTGFFAVLQLYLRRFRDHADPLLAPRNDVEQI